MRNAELYESRIDQFSSKQNFSNLNSEICDGIEDFEAHQQHSRHSKGERIASELTWSIIFVPENGLIEFF